MTTYRYFNLVQSGVNLINVIMFFATACPLHVAHWSANKLRHLAAANGVSSPNSPTIEVQNTTIILNRASIGRLHDNDTHCHGGRRPIGARFKLTVVLNFHFVCAYGHQCLEMQSLAMNFVARYTIEIVNRYTKHPRMMSRLSISTLLAHRYLENTSSLLFPFHSTHTRPYSHTRPCQC